MILILLSQLCNSSNLIGQPKSCFRNQENQLMSPNGVCVISAGLARDESNCWYGNLQDGMIKGQNYTGFVRLDALRKTAIQAQFHARDCNYSSSPARASKKHQEVIRADKIPLNINTTTKAKPIRGDVKPSLKSNPVTNPQICGRCGKGGHVGNNYAQLKRLYVTRFEKNHLPRTQHQDILFTIKRQLYTLTNNSGRCQC